MDIAPQIVRAAQAGRSADMEVLLAQLWPYAYRIAYSVLQERTLAEDAAQETCVIIYRELGSLRSAEAFPAWMYRIVMREALRRTKRDATRLPDSRRHAEPDIEARIDVLHALAQLPTHLRAVVVLHYYADLNSKEIGAALAIPSATVRFRLVRARKKLSFLLQIAHHPFTHAPEVCS